MLNRSTLTMIVLTLAFLMFISSSETAWKLEHTRYYDYANPVYLGMVLTGIGSLAVCFYCVLSLHHEAEEKVRKLEVMLRCPE